jgi:hypothetical protein
MAQASGQGQESNITKFKQAGMLSEDAARDLTAQQRLVIESWDQHTVETLISTYQETGEIQGGKEWI